MLQETLDELKRMISSLSKDGEIQIDLLQQVQPDTINRFQQELILGVFEQLREVIDYTYILKSLDTFYQHASDTLTENTLTIQLDVLQTFIYLLKGLKTLEGFRETQTML